MSERLTAAALAKASGRQPESVVLDQVRDCEHHGGRYVVARGIADPEEL